MSSRICNETKKKLYPDYGLLQPPSPPPLFLASGWPPPRPPTPQTSYLCFSSFPYVSGFSLSRLETKKIYPGHQATYASVIDSSGSINVRLQIRALYHRDVLNFHLLVGRAGSLFCYRIHNLVERIAIGNAAEGFPVFLLS